MTKRFKDAAELGLTEAELAAQVALAEEIVGELIAEERARKRFEVETYTAPACWASCLINGDASGLDYCNTPSDPAGDREIAAADAFIADVGLGGPVDCSEPEFMTYGWDYGDLAGDYCTYSFLREVEP